MDPCTDDTLDDLTAVELMNAAVGPVSATDVIALVRAGLTPELAEQMASARRDEETLRGLPPVTSADVMAMLALDLTAAKAAYLRWHPFGFVLAQWKTALQGWAALAADAQQMVAELQDGDGAPWDALMVLADPAHQTVIYGSHGTPPSPLLPEAVERLGEPDRLALVHLEELARTAYRFARATGSPDVVTLASSIDRRAAAVAMDIVGIGGERS